MIVLARISERNNIGGEDLRCFLFYTSKLFLLLCSAGKDICSQLASAEDELIDKEAHRYFLVCYELESRCANWNEKKKC